MESCLQTIRFWRARRCALRGRRDGFRGRALGERFEQSLALKLSRGRADVLPAVGEKAVHQRAERHASLHGFSVGRGVCEQKPFGSPQDAVGFGVEQLYFAELLNETANCFVSVVAGCTGAVHEMLASVGKIRLLFIDSLSRIGALTRTQQQSDPDLDDESHLETAFWKVALPWQALGLIDRDQRLTALGEWVLSCALAPRARSRARDGDFDREPRSRLIAAGGARHRARADP